MPKTGTQKPAMQGLIVLDIAKFNGLYAGGRLADRVRREGWSGHRRCPEVAEPEQRPYRSEGTNWAAMALALAPPEAGPAVAHRLP
jgi:hypothetical protein